MGLCTNPREGIGGGFESAISGTKRRRMPKLLGRILLPVTASAVLMAAPGTSWGAYLKLHINTDGKFASKHHFVVVDDLD